MALTVNAAFDSFRRDCVDLDPEEVKRARKSRDFLIEEIWKLPGKDDSFPWLTNTRLLFGSFARSTKIRPLDDIDIMFFMHGGGGTEYSSDSDEHTFRVDPGQMSSPVRDLVNLNGYISSVRVLNKFRDSLSDVPQYDKAELHRSHEAVTLKLKSYDWNFDIVPCFGVTSDGGLTTGHYDIPDGAGNWKRTDPRRDDKRVEIVNKKHDGKVLPLIRLLKYWNRRNQASTMSSYWFENLVLYVFERIDSFSSLRYGVAYFLLNCPILLLESYPDPKGLGPDLDEDVEDEVKQKISEAMVRARDIAVEALELESKDKTREAINEWKRVFGPDFPSYG